MNRYIKKPIVALAAGIVALSASLASAVEIEYWQYTYGSRVKAIDALIETFEAANPGITVKHTNFPYADYRKKVAIAVSAGDGPDVVQLYYGWLNDYRDSGLLQPLSKEAFPHASIESEFFPMVSTMKVDGDYWGLPTAVRALALFYNKDLFAAAGLSGAPETLDEMVEYAKKLTKKDSGGNYEVVGYATDGGAGQEHHFMREVLTRLFGGAPYSEDGTKVTYNDAAGAKALKYLTDFQMTHKTGASGFMNRGQDAFKAGKAGMVLDGSFRINTFKKVEELNFGIAELPGHEGNRYNFASYWINGISSKAEGEKLAAANKFLQHITNDAAMQLWLDTVGELPAKPAIALTDENQAHPYFGPFIRGLGYATATAFKSEKPQRQAIIDAIDMVTLQGVSPSDALNKVAKDEQEVLDDYYDN